MADSASPATWECPHCRARQPETGRCWVCHRSSTCCATCANFRSSLVGGLGYCGLDRSRQPLLGSEMRGCWEPARAIPVTLFDGVAAAEPPRAPAQPDRPARPAADTGVRRPALDWVPVDDVRPAVRPTPHPR